jgi:RNA-directed DNA polymerase
MTRWVPYVYRTEGERLGISLDIITDALKQAHLLQDKGLPAILSLGHLSFHTDIPYWKLRAFVARKLVIKGADSEPKAFQVYEPYRSFAIRKQSGGYRRICVPESDLLRVQQWIDRFILSRIKASPYSYAFEKGQSIIKCAEQHIGCKWLIKIDLRNFFESLSEIQVFRVFRDLGYSSLVAFELARICTKVRNSKRSIGLKWTNNRQRSIKAYQHPIIGHLPQGAPTSPKLANLIVRSLDYEVAKVAERFDLNYTRYADDMAFSTNSKVFSRDVGREFIHEIFRVFPHYGLRHHPQKVQIVPPGARKVILGLLVAGDKVRLSKEYRRAMECHWYYRAKDPVQHAKVRGFGSVLGLKNYLAGLTAYANHIDEKYLDVLVGKYGEIAWPI